MDTLTNTDSIVFDEMNNVSFEAVGGRWRTVGAVSGGHVGRWLSIPAHELKFTNAPSGDLLTEALSEAADRLISVYRETLDALAPSIAEAIHALPATPIPDLSNLERIIDTYRQVLEPLASRIELDYVNDAAPIDSPLLESSKPEPDVVVSLPDVDPNEDATAAYAVWLRATAAAQRTPARWLSLMESRPATLRTDMFEAMGEVAATAIDPTALVLAIVRGLNDDDAATRLGATLAMDAINSAEALPFLEYSMQEEEIPYIHGLQARVFERLRILKDAEGSPED